MEDHETHDTSQDTQQDTKAHLVVVGFDEIVSNKYLPCFEEAIAQGHIDGYSMIDLKSEEDAIRKRLQDVTLQPEHLYFLSDPRAKGLWSDPDEFGPILQALLQEKGRLKVYIATEVKAHEGYLRYCIEHGIDSLVEKPVFAPIHDNRFAPEAIEPTMQYFLEKIAEKPARHSVMTLSRYHRIYNHEVIEPLRAKLLEHQAPLTSFHFRTAGGVWNLHREYESRSDHPYKYGYGMLMHGAYHYIDLSAQFLALNKLLYPDVPFTLTVSSFAAHPADQNDRISKRYSAAFDDNDPTWAAQGDNATKYGETDITTTFCLKNKLTGHTLTLGTMSFEQTTPSIRTWKEIPDGMYNKNGRISFVDLEAQLSVLHTVNVQCFDIPVPENNNVDRIDAFARVSTRTNASLLPGEDYNTMQTFDGVFHRDSNRNLIVAWLNGTETKSDLASHLPVMHLVQALALSIKNPGHPVTFDFM